MPLQIRRGTEAERENLVTPPADGELLWITNDRKLYIGDGTTLAKDLIPVTGYDDEDAQDATAALFAAGTHGNISFVYDDPANSLSAIINLDNYDGVIGATGINAQVLGSGNFILFDNATNDVNLDGVIASHIVPTVTNDFDLGAESLKFKDAYLSNSLRIGEAHITGNGPGVNLPIGSTLGGVPLSTGGIVEGSNYRINIVAEDSSLLVDSVNSTFRGNVVSPATSDVVIDATQRIGTFEEINLAGFGVVNGNPIFLSTLVSIISSTPSAIEPTLAVAISNDGSLINAGGSISLSRSRGTPIAPSIVSNGDAIGAVEYGAFDGSAFVSVGKLSAIVDGTVVPSQPAPIKLDLSISNGTNIVNIATFKPTQVEFTAVPIVPNLTDAERNALTPQVGMMIYNTTLNKFQGYQNTDGNTLEWVDLS